MSNTPAQKASRDPPEDRFQLLTAAFRGSVVRQYFIYTPDATVHQDEFSTATQGKKRRKTVYDEIKPMTRESDDVESPIDDGRARSLPPGHVVIGSDSSSSTLAADSDGKEELHDQTSGDKKNDTKLNDAACEPDSGYEGGEESEEEESGTSSHTLGRSEGSSCTLGRSQDGDCDIKSDKDEDEDENMEGDESDDEGDLFAQSYRNGSRK